MSAPSPSVDLELAAGTLRATLVHGRVDFAWRRRGARAWDTNPKSLEQAAAFVGPLAVMVATGMHQRQPVEV